MLFLDCIVFKLSQQRLFLSLFCYGRNTKFYIFISVASWRVTLFSLGATHSTLVA